MAAAIEKLKLPTRLMDFFARYPPQTYSAKYTGVTLPLTRKEAKEAAIARAGAAGLETAIPNTPLANESDGTVRAEVQASGDQSTIPTPPSVPSSSNIRSKLPPSNPFLPRKNFVTGRWAGAKIGLRRQAELVKLAKGYGIEELLPPGQKSTAFKQARILERGLRVKGTGEGQKVKGHKWERHVGATLEKRRTAMENMPELVREWKQVRLLVLLSSRMTVLTYHSEVTEEGGRSIQSKTLGFGGGRSLGRFRACCTWTTSYVHILLSWTQGCRRQRHLRCVLDHPTYSWTFPEQTIPQVSGPIWAGGR